jgi:glyoxylase-like metal-dependent hydrolase (beta-lactamase superfamily II)
MLIAAAIPAFPQENNLFAYQVGAFEVRLLVETRSEGRASILIGADDALIRRYIPTGSYQSAVNTFLVRGGGLTVLVDTGFGTTLFENLKALGVSPESVDAVLITHMHGDHTGGLQRDGKPLFPRARVYIAQQERDFWAKTNGAAPLRAYGSRVETFLPGEPGSPVAELLPGITPIAAFGHTPGHTLFLVASEGQRLLIWADLMHAMDIQFPAPEVAVTYDTDPQAAVASRKRVLEYVVQNRIPIAGMHLPYPAIGDVQAREGVPGGYTFIPAR